MVFIDAALKSSLILAGTFCGLWALRRSSAATRHLVLAAGLALATLSPALTLMVPGWRVELPSAAPAPAAAPAAPTAVVGLEQSVSGARPVTAGTPPAPAPWPVLEFTKRHVYTGWLAGTAIALVLLLSGFVRLAWAARHASEASHPWRQMLDRVASHYALRNAPRLLQSRHPSLLVTWGVLRPVVLLPVAAPRWNDERMRVVLEHELAHVARRDWVVQIGAELVRCIYWFNPLVWIACRRLRQESEQACDDRVLASGHAATAYASHLLDLARVLRTSDGICIPAAAIARPSSLERRVAAMLTSDINRQPVTLRSAAAALFLLAALAVPVASFDAFAQTRFAAVSGVITDESGAALVGATLSLTNVQTKARHEVRSNQAGFYEFAGLSAGDYEFEVRRPAFEALKQPMAIGVGESLQRDVRLRVSNIQETLTILAGVTPPAPTDAPRPYTQTPRTLCPDASAGGCVGPPRKLKHVRPVYPPALESSGVEGEVEIEATIGTDGRVINMRVLSSPHPDFERSALDAVGEWEFTATTLNGRAIETRMNVRVGFGSSPRVP